METVSDPVMVSLIMVIRVTGEDIPNPAQIPAWRPRLAKFDSLPHCFKYQLGYIIAEFAGDGYGCPKCRQSKVGCLLCNTQKATAHKLRHSGRYPDEQLNLADA